MCENAYEKVEVLLVKYGEIALRGGNRRQYEDMLLNAIRRNLNATYPNEYTAYKEQGRFVVRKRVADGEPLSHLIPHISCVFGISSVTTAMRIEERSMDGIMAAALAFMREHSHPDQTFRVTTKRADKSFLGRSDDISRQVGGYLLEKIPALKVELHNPDLSLMIEIRGDVFVYSQDVEVQGPGGLPPGSAGKGVLLLSGGIDSPVAGYLAAKRGVELVCIYFHSPPYTSDRAKEKVLDLCKQLAHFTGKIRLLVVNFTQIQLALNDHTPPEKITILLKRSMLKMADKTAQKYKALALITGDAVGQVASQTLQSLHAMSGTTELPILRPLACFDKKDIIDIAKKIGTYGVSIRPYDDCCTLFLPKHPETKPKLSIIQSIEKDVPGLDEMMEKALNEAEIHRF
ncbi:MAG: tRNA 4-thiouridine(8) synthase ThiI [Defluviitaleaceae bacterium]|nr:tRNA 4-thiouridine(8) synthase ThiI [Defluviitaleaceae bacterium]